MRRLLIAMAILATLAGALLLWQEGSVARPRPSLQTADQSSQTSTAQAEDSTPPTTIQEGSNDSNHPPTEGEPNPAELQPKAEEPAVQKLPVTTPQQLIGVPLKARDDMVEVVLVNEAQEPILEPWTLIVAGHAGILEIDQSPGCGERAGPASYLSRPPACRYRSQAGLVRVPYFGHAVLYAAAIGNSFEPKTFAIPRDEKGDIKKRHVEVVATGVASTVLAKFLPTPGIGAESLTLRLLPCFHKNPNGRGSDDGVVVPMDDRKTIGASDLLYEAKMEVGEIEVRFHGPFESGVAQVLFGERILYQSEVFSLRRGGRHHLGSIALPPFQKLSLRYAVAGRFATNFLIYLPNQALAGIRRHQEEMLFGTQTNFRSNDGAGILLPLSATNPSLPFEVRVTTDLSTSALAHYPVHSDDLWRVRTALDNLTRHLVGSRPHILKPEELQQAEITLHLRVEDIASLLQEPATQQVLATAQSKLRPFLAHEADWRWLFAESPDPARLLDLVATAVGCDT